MDQLLSALGTINGLCETESPLFFASASVVLGLVLALLIAIVVWPLNGEIRIEDDPMRHPFGDMPLPPHREDWR
jgi:Zn-dependent protease